MLSTIIQAIVLVSVIADDEMVKEVPTTFAVTAIGVATATVPRD